jgi:hypothetical protein
MIAEGEWIHFGRASSWVFLRAKKNTPYDTIKNGDLTDELHGALFWTNPKNRVRTLEPFSRGTLILMFGLVCWQMTIICFFIYYNYAGSREIHMILYILKRDKLYSEYCT